jgi:hypothetical protein
MSISRGRTAGLTLALSGALLSVASRPGAAQHSITVKADAPDSVAWIVPRQPLGVAEATLRTRDRHAAVLLNDTTLVLQLTDRGLANVTDHADEDTSRTVGGRILARMLGAGLAEMLDHGIAYRLSSLREAREDGGRLVLVDTQGRRVFDEVEVNGRRVMDDFSPADAERFAAKVNQAIRNQKRQ